MTESAVSILRARRIVPTIAVERRTMVDDWIMRGCLRGKLHEVVAAEAGDAASGAGFAVALAIVAGALPILWLRTERDERAAGLVHASGLAELGLAAEMLLLGAVRDERMLLRAAADAARCEGLGTILIELHGRADGYDLTATRRLKLAAERSGTTVLTLRVGAEATPSAAETRWGVSAGASQALAANAPGHPVFDVEMLRRRGGPAGARWCVEWNRDDKIFRRPALSGAGLSLATDRAAARDAPASVRRTG